MPRRSTDPACVRMAGLQICFAFAIFAVVILVIAFDVIDMVVAALLGVCAMITLAAGFTEWPTATLPVVVRK